MGLDGYVQCNCIKEDKIKIPPIVVFRYAISCKVAQIFV